MVDPLERATLQAAWNELIAHRAASHGNIAMMNFLIRFHQYHHHPWLPRSLATILRCTCSCSCPDFAGQRAFGNAPRRFDDPLQACGLSTLAHGRHRRQGPDPHLRNAWV
jgi:hypothetical protein